MENVNVNVNETDSTNVISKIHSTSFAGSMKEKEQVFRAPSINFKFKSIQKKINMRRKNQIYSDLIQKHSIFKDERRIFHKPKKYKTHSSKHARTEITSDKNIAVLLKSEGLLDYIKRGSLIPYEISRNISKKTGFKSTRHLNDYISANRSKFIVLCDKKEKYCQNEDVKCNSFYRRSDSVDLGLYFTHHYGNIKFMQ